MNAHSSKLTPHLPAVHLVAKFSILTPSRIKLFRIVYSSIYTFDLSISSSKHKNQPHPDRGTLREERPDLLDVQRLHRHPETGTGHLQVRQPVRRRRQARHRNQQGPERQLGRSLYGR